MPHDGVASAGYRPNLGIRSRKPPPRHILDSDSRSIISSKIIEGLVGSAVYLSRNRADAIEGEGIPIDRRNMTQIYQLKAMDLGLYACFPLPSNHPHRWPKDSWLIGLHANSLQPEEPS